MKQCSNHGDHSLNVLFVEGAIKEREHEAGCNQPQDQDGSFYLQFMIYFAP